MQNNKRIAKNTLLLYVRMFFMMAISLYTSRINLDSLGIVNYGIYGAVGGMVAMFSIISGSLSVAISRYLTYELGTGNKARLNSIFCTSVNIQIAMSFVIVLIAEIVGVWFLNTHMNIPPDRMYAANWVLQCSVVTFVIGLISVPYNALIIAHERMSAFAYISIVEAVLKLAICYLLYVSPIDKLIVWAVMLMFVQMFMRLVYGVYCKRYFAEARYRMTIDKPLLKDMSKFIGWAFFGNGVVVLKDQGSNVLLNIFCGPVVNAAQGVATHVNTAVSQLVTNFLMAVNPQITKSYSGGDLEPMHKLIIRAGKFGFFILLLVFFPLWANLDFVLNLWLVEVPEHTANFIVLIMMYAMLDCFGNPLVNGVLAEGNIKRYEINLTVLYVSNFLASLVFLKMGFMPEIVFVLNVIFKIFVVGALLLQSSQRYAFPIRRFFLQSALPSLTVFCTCALFVRLVEIPIANEYAHFVISVLVVFIFTAVIEYSIGLTKNEATFIKKQIIKKIHKQ